MTNRFAQLDDGLGALSAQQNSDIALFGYPRVIEKLNAQLAQQAEQLAKAREAIQDYLDGDYESPRSTRPQRCKHGLAYYETCENCIYEHFQKALSALSALTTPEHRSAG